MEASAEMNANVTPAVDDSRFKRTPQQRGVSSRRSGFFEEELDKHIDMLHEYNDIKDITQTLLGRLAGLRGVTTRDLYNDFGLELDD
ncbi:DNA repair protein SWI5 -like protein [Triplophysa tibetana]|uniref:DNA repair protein SWI5 homolog n=1 Tax=Triplophysa tibetana TaxID=1572043 RepID=A0A5A9N3J1_9TELE|nr:DNA repair protein SWI5 -like protein [Triplophysa tibetana]